MFGGRFDPDRSGCEQSEAVVPPFDGRRIQTHETCAAKEEEYDDFLVKEERRVDIVDVVEFPQIRLMNSARICEQ